MKQKEGFEFAKLAEKETLTATAISDCSIAKDATGYNVMASLKGVKYPDEYIVITAHTDAYFHCLQDDSISVGLLFSMAKAMVDADYKPDRTIIFVTTDGEECGKLNTFYDWLVGSWALVNDKVNEWGGKIVDSHTLELVGDKPSDNLGYRVSDSMYLFTSAVADSLNKSGTYDADVSVENYMATSSDEWSFSYMGVPTTRTIRDNKSDEVYHSSMDTPDRFSNERFDNYLRAHSALIMRIDKTPVIPYDFDRTARTYGQNINPKLLAQQGINTASLEPSMESYITDASSLLDKNLEIAQLYHNAKASGKDMKKADQMIMDYNEALRAAAKTMIQGTQYIALDTPVFQTDYYQYLPIQYSNAIDYLKAGNGAAMLENFDLDNDDQGQYTTYYSTTLEEKSWQNAYLEALDPDMAGHDYYWVTDRLLKYYDYYHILENTAAKVDAGEKDFKTEIDELTAIQKDSVKRLSNAYNEDMAMWKKVQGQLPLEQADKIIAELGQNSPAADK